MKKVILALVLAVLVVPAALADNVDFSLHGIGLSWSWAGGAAPLTASSVTIDATGQVGVFSNTITVGPGGFTTGAFLGGTGTAGDPFTWGAAALNSFVINGCLGPCFIGSITSLSLAHNASGNLAFNADVVVGSVSPLLFVLMGLPIPVGINLPWQGSITGTLHGNATLNGGSGTNGSLDMVLEPVPEPGTLALFGSGLIGIAGVVRRKIMSLR